MATLPNLSLGSTRCAQGELDLSRCLAHISFHKYIMTVRLHFIAKQCLNIVERRDTLEFYLPFQPLFYWMSQAPGAIWVRLLWPGTLGRILPAGAAFERPSEAVHNR